MKTAVLLVEVLLLMLKEYEDFLIFANNDTYMVSKNGVEKHFTGGAAAPLSPSSSAPDSTVPLK